MRNWNVAYKTWQNQSLTPELQKKQEKVEAQMVITAKAKQAVDIAEMEIERLLLRTSTIVGYPGKGTKGRKGAPR